MPGNLEYNEWGELRFDDYDYLFDDVSYDASDYTSDESSTNDHDTCPNCGNIVSNLYCDDCNIDLLTFWFIFCSHAISYLTRFKDKMWDFVF